MLFGWPINTEERGKIASFLRDHQLTMEGGDQMLDDSPWKPPTDTAGADDGRGTPPPPPPVAPPPPPGAVPHQPTAEAPVSPPVGPRATSTPTLPDAASIGLPRPQVSTPPSTDAPLVTAGQSAERPARSRMLAVGAFVAVVAVVAAGVFAITSFTGSAGTGGAETPDDLGAQLLTSIENEDLLGALDLLLPGERRSLGEPFVDLIGELQRVEVLAATDLSDLGGIDVELTAERIQVRPTNVSDIVNVDLAADVLVTIDGAEIPVGDLITDSLADDALAELRGTREAESSSFDIWLTAVQHDERWYFSVLHSIAELGRRDGTSGSPVPTQGLTAIGADTPEGAFDLLLAEIETLDVEGIIQLLNPDEAAALQRYAPLFLADAQAEIASIPVQMRFSDKEIRIDGEGDERTVFVDALAFEGSVDSTDFELSYDDGCVRGSGGGESFEACNAGGVRPFDVFPPGSEMAELIEAIQDAFSDMDESGIELRQVDGQWFVSPVATMTEGLLNAVRAIDREEIDRIIDLVGPDTADLGGLLLGGLLAGGVDEFVDGTAVIAATPGDESAAEPVDAVAETILEEPGAEPEFDDDPEYFSCYDVPEAEVAADCFESFVASGEMAAEAVPVELRFPECGYADLRWSGDVYALSDEEFMAAITPASECFGDLVDQGIVSRFELPNELAYVDCFEGRNWYQVLDDPEYDERYYACIDAATDR